MDDFSTRLVKAMHDLDLTQDILARLIGRSRALIGMYVQGKRSPQFQTLQRLEKVLKTPPGWLMYGENASKNLNNINQILTKSSYISVPILSLNELYNYVINAKLPPQLQYFNIQQGEEFMFGDRVCVSKMVGSSMASSNPTESILDGDILIIDPDYEYKIGSIVAAKHSSGTVIRQYQQDGDVILLIPHNAQVPTLQLDENSTIIGVVRGFQRNFK